MLRRVNGWMVAVLLFVLIGLVEQVRVNLWGVVIPLAIFGVIVYFLKRPPKWLLKQTSKRMYAGHKKPKLIQMNNGNQKKKIHRRRHGTVTLRVIDGYKKDFPPRRKTQ